MKLLLPKARFSFERDKRHKASTIQNIFRKRGKRVTFPSVLIEPNSTKKQSLVTTKAPPRITLEEMNLYHTLIMQPLAAKLIKG